MVRNFFSRVKKSVNDEPKSSSKAQAPSTIGVLSSMLGPSGRITLGSLKWFIQESGKDYFIEVVQNPVLMGSALNAENLSASEHLDEEPRGSSNLYKLHKTHRVNLDDQITKVSGPGSSLPYAIYPLMKRTDAESPADTFKIGRTKDNDMSMKAMAISKLHAVIRISNGTFYIEDCGSTNGSTLNGRSLTKKPVKLHDKDAVSFGNFEYTFLTPASLHDLLTKS
jgi:FHA domain